jgi:mono/diheme cytochrome c family protein
MGAVLLGAVFWVCLPALAQDDPMLSEARKVAGAVPPKLLDVLNTQIAKDGVASAVTVCQEKAPQMAKAASEQSGWAIRRVSLRNRNPKAVPDAWELAALEDFDSRTAVGEKPASLEKYGVVEEAGRKEYRYMKALPVQQVCVACHGVSEQIKPEVAERLNALYPADKATGYAIGQIRGAITIRKAL